MFPLEAVMALIGWLGLLLEMLLDGVHEAASSRTEKHVWSNLPFLTPRVAHKNDHKREWNCSGFSVFE